MNGQTGVDWGALKLTTNYKGISDTNPIMTQDFGADPYAMVYGDRVYFYMTADAYEYDAEGNVKENSYSKIASLHVVSTADMVNFTDHGLIRAAGPEGAAKWAHNSWAPAAAWKEIDGKPKFFLYFADNGGGIGVLTSDSPTGPFEDPVGHALVSRSVPTCAEVLWLFDPAVLVDDDGTGYLYFGGGVPEGQASHPKTARVVQLGDDMISLASDPVMIDPPYLFEDSGIHKANGKYYYTYCSNFSVDEEGTAQYGFINGEIVCMESDSPMGPFTFKEVILENPGRKFGLSGNNHHCVFQFRDQWYITYHSRLLEKKIGIEKGYRCTHIDEFTMGADGSIGKILQTFDGRSAVGHVDPYASNSAVCVAAMAGTDAVAEGQGASGELVLGAIDAGDYIQIQSVDFGAGGAKAFVVRVRKSEGGADGAKAVKACLDKPFAEAVAVLELPEELSGDWAEYRVSVTDAPADVHNLYLIFAGSGYEVESWKFE